MAYIADPPAARQASPSSEYIDAGMVKVQRTYGRATMRWAIHMTGKSSPSSVYPPIAIQRHTKLSTKQSRAKKPTQNRRSSQVPTFGIMMYIMKYIMKKPKFCDHIMAALNRIFGLSSGRERTVSAAAAAVRSAATVEEMIAVRAVAP